jgi:hypothetical protein
VVPRLPSGAQSMGDVDAVATDDAWAVGSSSAPGAAMIVHWNGSEWRLTRGPRFTRGADLRGIVETGPERAWVVGTAGSHGLILRWNGTSWRRARLPFDPERSPSLSSIAAVSRHDVWAVGTIRSLGVTRPLGSRTRWRCIGTAQLGAGTSAHAGAFPESLDSVTARASDDAWAVGTTADENAPTNPGLIYHWNGTKWSESPYPFIGSGQNRLTSVSAPAATAAWIVGGDGGGTRQPFALVWNRSPGLATRSRPFLATWAPCRVWPCCRQEMGGRPGHIGRLRAAVVQTDPGCSPSVLSQPSSRSLTQHASG